MFIGLAHLHYDNNKQDGIQHVSCEPVDMKRAVKQQQTPRK